MSCAVFPSTYRNIQHGVSLASTLFCSMYQVLFNNATHQVKAIAIGVSEANPLVEIGDCCSCVHLHVFLPTNPQNRYKELFPNTHFYVSLYSRFCGFIGITFNNVTFCLKLDHDDGTVKHILNHLNTT